MSHPRYGSFQSLVQSVTNALKARYNPLGAANLRLATVPVKVAPSTSSVTSALATVLLAVTSVALFAACERVDTADDSRSTLTVLHPDAKGIFGAGWPAKFLVFLPLVARNESGEIEGRLIRSWEHSEDHRTWTMHMRRGLKWEDGVPVTAQDVAFTLNLLAHPAVLMHEPGSFKIDVIDDSTYTIELLRRASAGTAYDLFTAAYPKHLLQTLDPESFYEWEFWSHPVGNGPYTVSRIVPHTAVELVARPKHYRGEPSIKRVVLKLGHDSGATFSASALPALLSGEVDAVPYVRQVDLLAMQGRSEFTTYYALDHRRAVGFFWNLVVLPFESRLVRQAIALSIDRQEIRKAMNLPDEVPEIVAPVSDRQLRQGAIPSTYPSDLTQAATLLDSAGWIDSDNDGIRERDGVRLAATVLVSDWQQADRIGLLIRSQLKQVGVSVQLESLEVAALRDRVLRGEFEAAIFVAFGQVSPNVLLGVNSPLGYENEEVAEIVATQKTLFDPVEYDRLNVRLAELVRADPPGVFLFNPVYSTVVRRHVKGLSSPWREDPLWVADELWIEAPESVNR